jgi:hypothetical protein
MATTTEVPRHEARAILDADALLAAALTEAGRSRFTDRDFEEPLRRWLDASLSEARVNALGVELLRANIMRLLVNRLRFEADVEEHPEILEEDVADPIVIIGFPRTGTTKLQRMLSGHPRVRGLEFWRLMNPAPLPGAAEPDPRIAIADAQLAATTQMFPDWQAGHPSATHQPDEEIFLMELTFEAVSYWRTRVPGFLDWVRRRPRQIPYEYLRRMLRYLQWQQGGKQGRSLVLKTPLHVGNLDLVAAYFPRATVVHCHRDPRVALPSNARLHELMRRMATDHIDLLDVGNEVIEFWGAAAAANIAQRRDLGDALSVVDVRYEEILDDPLAVIRSVLAARDIELADSDIVAMRRWEAENPQHAHGQHRYTGEAYGLDATRIERAFTAYMEHFYPGDTP